MKTCVLLVNLGTPDSPKTGDVRTYLGEFLNDPRVIDINAVGRTVLVNGIIVPFRSPKSSKIYKELWDHWNGESPLLTYGLELKDKLQEKFKNENITVEFAMRYRKPSLEMVLEKIKSENYEQIIIMPLFPQYASATTGSVMERVMKIISKWWVIPELKFINNYFDHPKFIEAFVKRGEAYNWKDYDHVVFSYHGLPERQIEKVHPNLTCSDCNCPEQLNTTEKLCYRNQCYQTSRLIAEKLGIPKEKYTVAFQSRLGKNPWLSPYADQLVEQSAQKGMKKLLFFSPAFVADCLETTIEIGDEYQELFEEKGGEKVQLVPSLNAEEEWISACEAIIKERI